MSDDLVERIVRTVVKVMAVVLVTLLVLTAIGWAIRTVSGGLDEEDVSTVEG